MSSTRNDITGDKIQTKPTTEEYRSEWERIFGDKDQEVIEEDHAKEAS